VDEDAAATGPVPFTADDFAARRARAAEVSREAGLAGLLMTPGPDLLYFTGYAPVAITERITVLVIPVNGDATMLVPRLERPDAENAAGVAGLRLMDWADGNDPYEATARLLASTGRYAISDSAWAMHVLGLQVELPQSSYVSLTSGLPMLRAVKDAAEVERLAAAAAAADRAYEEILQAQFAGRRETEVAADLAGLLRQFGHSPLDFTVVGSGPHGANRITRSANGSSRTATWSCSASEGRSTGTGRTRHEPSTWVRPPTRSVSPPDRARHRDHYPRTAVHGGG
jgi:D-alanyl-D-alanine dipeptidase